MWDEVRLVSRSPTAGIVELKQSDGSWNKVCADEFWTTQVAEVICHHLGFSSAVKPRARVRPFYCDCKVNAYTVVIDTFNEGS